MEAKVRIEYLPKDEFKKRFGSGWGGKHWTEEGEHIIVLPKGASTKTRMHEIAHAELGHETVDSITLHESVQRELAADAWVYERLGTNPTFTELLQDLCPMAEQAFKLGYTVSNVMAWLLQELSEAGYELNRRERSELWWWLRSLQKEVG